MRIAIGGKGGVGKTTIAATLTRLLGRREGRALAVDGDSNPNLAVALGLPQSDAMSLPTVPWPWLIFCKISFRFVIEAVVSR